MADLVDAIGLRLRALAAEKQADAEAHEAAAAGEKALAQALETLADNLTHLPDDESEFIINLLLPQADEHGRFPYKSDKHLAANITKMLRQTVSHVEASLSPLPSADAPPVPPPPAGSED